MVNSEFSKDIKKALDKESISSELDAGATPRRYEPEGGVKKLNERIHKESKIMDNKNLPFSFSKPPKTNKTVVAKFCSNCGHKVFVSRNSISIICSSCKTFSSLKDDLIVEEIVE